MRRHFRSENGQASAEYILVLFFVVLVFLAAVKTLLWPALQKARSQLSALFSSMFSSSDNLHRLMFKIPK